MELFKFKEELSALTKSRFEDNVSAVIALSNFKVKARASGYNPDKLGNVVAIGNKIVIKRQKKQ